MGGNWVSTMGNYLGTFKKPFLDILPTGHIAHIRFHEFYRFENNKVVEIQTIWDLPELMISSNSWPLAPQLGTYMYTPSPLTGDGLYISGDGQKSEKRVKEMLTDLCRHPDNPDPNVMNLAEHWHPHFNWYGPAGIGSCKGIDGFRNWHQIPFLKAMPDRKVDQNSNRLSSWSADTHWISEGNYVSETGWPNMVMNLKYDGWMGIAPVDKNITLRSLDFWRIGEDGRIRENWVLVDLLDMYHQIGVDVFSRIKEFNKAKSFSFSEVEGNKK
jgi:predicted ester cyclase